MSKQLDDALIWETIYGQVIGKANNYTIGNNGGLRHIIKNDRIRQYERSFIQQCRIYKDRHINSRFTLYINVWQSSQRYDIDNSIKTVLDCLQYAGAITNDSLCVSLIANKYIDRANPRITFAILSEDKELTFKGFSFENNNNLTI